MYSINLYSLSLTVEPTTNAADIIIRFFIMYWPSRVSPNGKFVKQISGNNISGRKVPGIWINSKIIDILIIGFIHIVIPIMTSHQPSMGTKVFGFSNQ